MRTPGDMPRPSSAPKTHTGLSRRRVVIIVVIALIVIGLISLRALATFYTDALWFSSVHLSSVWSTLLGVKLGLFFVFGAVFFVLMWANLFIADRLATWTKLIGPEDELVRRYQQTVEPHARWIRIVLSLLFALVAGLTALGQWQHWLLFSNGGSFDKVDPQFHENVGFFVFKLPFLSFLVGWLFTSLVVVFVMTAIAHYLDGGIRVQGQGPGPRVNPRVKAHLSLILALMALVKAFGYYIQRYSLDMSTSGYVEGAGYTDVHARLPALNLLILISLAAFVILVVNIWRRGWTLPVLAVGLWAFVALVIGAIYPAIIQRFKVAPAQDALEQPYIARNIAATRYAFGINHVRQVPFQGGSNLTASELEQHSSTLSDVRLWDPSLTTQTYQKLQSLRSYYEFTDLAVDRFKVNGQLVPAVVGVRQINASDLPDESWVNRHLQYTHGYGAIIAPANTATGDGDPVFDVGDLPPTSANGFPKITQPNVYFGVAGPGTNASFVVANTRQPELDYQLPDGANVESHYRGDGGVQLSSVFRRAAFALRFGDLNLLISDLITPQSRIMFVQDVQSRVSKAAPFLQLGTNPYPVILNGGIYWVVNAYTTSSHYPYSQTPNTTALAPGSYLPGNFNYVRNSVKVLVSAYTGQMTFYVTDPHDPIIQAYERAFPHMFTPASHMSTQLLDQLRYPEDLFTMQSQLYGRYHITNPEAFYNAGDAWTLSESPGNGSPSAALATTTPTNAQGLPIGPTQVQRMTPIYQVMTIPGESSPSFNILDAYVPVAQGSQIQTLSGFMVAGSDPSNYGQLTAFVTPSGDSIDGPALIDSRISATPSVSKVITLLGQNGSSVLLGNVMVLPIDNSIVYVRALYVQSSRNSLPEIKDVIVVHGSQAAIGATLPDALAGVFPGYAGITSNPTSSSSPGSIPASTSPKVQQLLAEASSAYQQAQADLKSGNLGGYQQEVNQVGTYLSQAQQAASAAPSSTTTTPSSKAPSDSSASGPPASASMTAAKTRSSKSPTTTTTVNPADQA